MNQKSLKALAVPITNVSRRLRVVATSVQGSSSQAFLDSWCGAKLLILRCCGPAGARDRGDSKNVSVAPGHGSDTVGIVKSLPISLESLNEALEFLSFEGLYMLNS